MLYNTAARESTHFPNLMEFGCIGLGGVENNKDRSSECSIINVNECEQESACRYEHLIINY